MKTGKSEDRAFAICTTQLKDSYLGTFNDSAVFDPTEKTALSVRDGVIEYLGSELNMLPADKLFTVYRSPATIANTAMKMQNIPITDEHVSLDMPAPEGGGFISEAEMVDASDSSTLTTIAIKNKLSICDTILAMVEAGKRELSLGYHAELVPHDEYDFEQRGIMPHHLATVDRGRCGPMCSFIDRKPQSIEEEKPMTTKLHKAFIDAEGAMNLQQIVELATALPEAIKSVPVDQLQELLPALQQIVEAAKGVLPAADEEIDEEETMRLPAGDEDTATKEEEEKKFSDAVAKAASKKADEFTDKAIKQHATIIEKARSFLSDEYVFSDKNTVQIMRDALATETSESFADSELPLAFKMLKKPDANYKEFGDTKTNDLDKLKDKEI